MAPQRFLAIDIGRKRTGVAFGEATVGIAFPLSTISHDSLSLLADEVVNTAKERVADMLIVGLPLLPSGDEGEQARYVRSAGELLSSRLEIPLFYLDERYTTQYIADVDTDASSASRLLNIYFEKYLTK